ncbi:hypothetical protein K402DRAFT_342677 [Aulographum hederae CBS 113979]|uniref:Ubiquitin-like domain-containing protein n=1 Tax=Aulographum hederae CBS 113979 TaxID=1176131 RepID=A0A6G1GKM2_9PEZI|nr:hypothetical protein K402DRAFT_342677 [Aulographum hederae CBS 113979]
MSELGFAKQYLTALDSRPVKLSSDHVADPKSYPAQAAYTLPRISLTKRKRTSPTSAPADNSTTSASNPSKPPSTTLTITLKPSRGPTAPLTLPSLPPTTSIYDLKSLFATSTSLPLSKIKILRDKKPVPDSKTLKEFLPSEDEDPDAVAVSAMEFGVMVLGGATPATATPVAGTPETERKEPTMADGPGKEFWGDLKGFLVQRLKDEREGERLVKVFRNAVGGEVSTWFH